MDQNPWEPARLIPVSGITGADEQERRGVSSLLAVLASVKEFGRAITAPLGAPAGTLSTYIEVPFSLGDRQFRPDGLIQITRAGRTWTALVEVKTGRNNLEQAQLEAYSDDARRTSDDVDRKKLKKVSLFSLS